MGFECFLRKPHGRSCIMCCFAFGDGISQISIFFLALGLELGFGFKKSLSVVVGVGVGVGAGAGAGADAATASVAISVDSCDVRCSLETTAGCVFRDFSNAFFFS